MRITCFENQPIRNTVLEAIESDWLISNKRETQAFRVFFPFSFLSFEYSNTLIQGTAYYVYNLVYFCNSLLEQQIELVLMF